MIHVANTSTTKCSACGLIRMAGLVLLYGPALEVVSGDGDHGEHLHDEVQHVLDATVYQHGHLELVHAMRQPAHGEVAHRTDSHAKSERHHGVEERTPTRARHCPPRARHRAQGAAPPGLRRHRRDDGHRAHDVQVEVELEREDREQRVDQEQLKRVAPEDN